MDQTKPMKPKQKRGLALVSVERRRAIARLGGRTAHALGRAHRFTEETARAAGRKGAEMAREAEGGEAA